VKEHIHSLICQNKATLNSWFSERTAGVYLPFYSSYDIRDSGSKFGVVDGNIYPAGFNNICQVDKEQASESTLRFLQERFPKVQNILLVTEDHFKNSFYWENVHSIVSFIAENGIAVRVGMLSKELKEPVEMESFKGSKVLAEPVISIDGQLQLDGFVPDLVISNNDFTNAYEEVNFSNTTVIPARELGWFQRRKSNFFNYYNEHAEQFSSLLGLDPNLFKVQTRLFENFDITEESSKADLAEKTEEMLSDLGQYYKKAGIDQKPFLVIKNNSGTYGLAVTKVESGEDVLSWNYKTRKKMKAAKGGGGVSELILQEGIPTVVKADADVAEPAIYMIGSELVGGFLRTHSKKNENESLNSPGAVYKKLCLSDLKFKTGDCLQENVYGWVAKLGLLAIVEEAKKLEL